MSAPPPPPYFTLLTLQGITPYNPIPFTVMNHPGPPSLPGAQRLYAATAAAYRHEVLGKYYGMNFVSTSEIMGMKTKANVKNVMRVPKGQQFFPRKARGKGQEGTAGKKGDDEIATGLWALERDDGDIKVVFEK